MLQETEQSLGDPLAALAEGRVKSVEISGGHVVCDAPRRGRVYLPGSFNPLHDGHRYLPPFGASALSDTKTASQAGWQYSALRLQEATSSSV